MRNGKPINTDFRTDASPFLIHKMAARAQEMAIDTGTELFRQGDPGDSVFAIRSGSLEFSIVSPEGRKLSLDVMHKGALFGEISLFDPGPRTATVTALEPARLWTISNAEMLAAVHEDAAVAFELLRLAGKRMRWMGHQLSEQVFQSLPALLAGKILYLTVHDTDDQPMLNLSKTQLAEFTGASREAVSKILSAWARDGYVASTRRGLRLLDRAALHELANITET